jgi:leader peptidase (prepilin peptidase)/N-methyltransferase
MLAEFLTYIGLYLNTVMMGLWIFVLGACIGSFLNVVIYRLPAGMALSHPDSRCPQCETELSARDNIPIIGWIALGGKCRYCNVPISARYPLIESLVGLLFLTLFLVETWRGAVNLPAVSLSDLNTGAVDAIFRLGQWELLGWFAVHAFYLTITLAVCMIAVDGHSTPVKLTQAGIVVGLLIGIVWPNMRPVHVIMPLPQDLNQYWGVVWRAPGWLGQESMMTGIGFAGIVDGLAGVGSGLLTGWLADRAFDRDAVLSSALRTVFVLAGVYCGWQLPWSLLAVVLFIIAVIFPLSRSTQRSTLALALFASCSTLILYWSRLMNGVLFIRHDGWRWTSTSAVVDWIFTAGVIAATAVGMSCLPRNPETTTEQAPSD